eukprot:TRINITY_DN42029_c0_g1_i1.p1 TRINITY_DN42029_c0_g1~~TRINITY_DN42029_c0_g1_i1.p1  ORF type:complete len:120 (-),score=26.16 TRINITY_DN42029_c0_g1_i1:56-415(-)
MIRRPPRSTLSSSSAASDVYKRQVSTQSTGPSIKSIQIAVVVVEMPTPSRIMVVPLEEEESIGVQPVIPISHIIGVPPAVASINAPTAEPPPAVSYTHLRAHETPEHLVCRLLLEKKQI